MIFILLEISFNFFTRQEWAVWPLYFRITLPDFLFDLNFYSCFLSTSIGCHCCNEHCLFLSCLISLWKKRPHILCYLMSKEASYLLPWMPWSLLLILMFSLIWSFSFLWWKSFSQFLSWLWSERLLFCRFHHWHTPWSLRFSFQFSFWSLQFLLHLQLQSLNCWISM